ncbi:MAG TPA: DUF4440 domain-containing protein [Puia sp.]|nr:DUF4440 domain-containing protein [Puia sp.]
MGKLILSFFFLLAAGSCLAQTDAAQAIRKVMADQAGAWNHGSIDGFMKGYWNNDSLVFVGQSGLTYGYAQTLSNYKKHYDTPEKMGKLFFTLLSIRQLSPDYCFVLGKWLVKRQAGDIGGTYSCFSGRSAGAG